MNSVVVSEQHGRPFDDAHASARLRPRTYKLKKREGRDSGPLQEKRLCEGQEQRHPRKRPTWLQSIAHAPSYAPTEAEFQDPVAFVRRIETEAAQYGICKITVPRKYRDHVDRFPAALRDFTFTAREQKLREHVWDRFGQTEIIYEHAQAFTVEQFRGVARAAAEKLLNQSEKLPPAFVEAEFWRQRNSRDARDIYILYGNDVEGSACDRADPHNIGSTAWNLQDLGKAPWSLLRHTPVDYPGVTTPMLYVGSLFATFFWHVEDHWMHSINYAHYGATKTWYGVPSSHAEAFEQVVLDKVYRRALQLKRKDLDDPSALQKCALKQLLAKNTLFLPKLLLEAGVPVFRVDQKPGDFVVTFPRGYHAGFSHGFNIGEAVNFALPEWLPSGALSLERYCRLSVPQILPHELILIKEAADVFDRLERESARPTGPQCTTLAQFVAFVDAHARLRFQVSAEKGLQEVASATPLRSQICFMCYRHIGGCFVFHSETGASRCMQCSVRARHVSHPDWRLAVPDVVEMMHFLAEQFSLRYGIDAVRHPLERNVPRRRRSLTQRRVEKRPHDGAANQPMLKKPRSDVAFCSRESLALPRGMFERTVVRRDGETFLLAQELLLALGAPIETPHLVEYCLRRLLPTAVAPLVSRSSAVQLMEAIQDSEMRETLGLFLRGVWSI